MVATRSAPAVPSASPQMVGAVAFLVLTAVLGVLGNALLNDGDTLWHLATAEWMVANGRLPSTDPFSYTASGQPWIAKEWLSQLAFLGAERVAGWGGVVWLTAIAAGTAFAILATSLARHVGVRTVAVVSATAFVLTAPHLLARPHVLALPFAVAWTAAVFRAADDADGPPWPALVLMVVWVNLHAGASLGLVLAGGAALDAIVRGWDGPERMAVIRSWASFGLAGVAAASVTPYGPRSVLVTLDILRLGPALDVIPEWQPQDFGSVGPFEVVLLAAIALALVRGVRLPVVRVLVLIGLLHLALSSTRNGELLGMLAPLVLVGPLTGGSRTPDDERRRAMTDGGRTAGVVAAGLIACAIAVAATAPRPPAALQPDAALAAARDAGATRLLHEYGFGGHLVRAGVPTFVDGRTELFGGEFVARHAAALALEDLAGLDELLTTHDVEATLLRPTTPAVALLDRSPTWRRVHADGLAVVHVRDDAPPGLGLPPAP